MSDTMDIRDLGMFTRELPEDRDIAESYVRITAKGLLELYDEHVIDGYDEGSEIISGIGDPLLGRDFSLEYVILDSASSPGPNFERFAKLILEQPEQFRNAETLTIAYIIRKGFKNALEGELDPHLNRQDCLLGMYRLMAEMIKQKTQ